MGAPYEGDVMHRCLLTPFDFQNTSVVVVSGAKWNPCGHAILNTGGMGGWYFHIAGFNDPPKFMRPDGFFVYLRSNSKKVIRRSPIKIPNPAGSHAKLEELLANQWWWFLLPNNCASFIEDVVKAGGSTAGLYSNCPTLESFR